jgi:hypothetical protein
MPAGRSLTMLDHDDDGDEQQVHLESIPSLRDRIESFIHRGSFYDVFWYGGPEERVLRPAMLPHPTRREKIPVGALFNSEWFWRIRRARIERKGERLYDELDEKYKQAFKMKAMCVIARKNEPFAVSIIVVMAQVGGAIQLIQIAHTAIRYTAQEVFGRKFREGQQNAGAQQEGARVALSANVLAWILVTNAIILGILVFQFFGGPIFEVLKSLASSR